LASDHSYEKHKERREYGDVKEKNPFTDADPQVTSMQSSSHKDLSCDKKI
jgi:hypothetical protein